MQRLQIDLSLLYIGFIINEGQWPAETLAMDYHRGAGVEALRKEPLIVYGDGKQTRSFHFVLDLLLIEIKKISRPLPTIRPEPLGRLCRINNNSCTEYGRIPRYDFPTLNVLLEVCELSAALHMP
ncbi:hypothetical protein L1987_57658 [Smallanthus sonchifolius]|uniref:Uncharacterized protein n=1 Tax=Smallanthus sonchifolius TaxID=185202 RepID=A0ACB9DD71_9ASTR|nr:hypothetical protein L1987_57658 [Smallanthus sonchifolius]